MALSVVKCLRIDHVKAKTFSQVGAFPIFLREDIKHSVPKPTFVGTESHYVWRTLDCITIATSKKRAVRKDQFNASKMKWSCFRLKSTNDWEEMDYSGHLDVGKDLHLILTVPNFYRAISEIREDPDST